eukprot:TRINITY_DN12379_c0_g1_i1.p1 TRINITY_DN12379_c0_g1~~TRINITY_DN12379_c0_g1_i1.p1  ORF type:complete len:392 (+),score=76.54 TRINITY_DN12379_c0_g1_i1:46-1176(+)
MVDKEPEDPPKEQEDAAGSRRESKVEEEKPKIKLERNKTLWENIAASKPGGNVEMQDINVLVVGGKRAGKSTLIQKFIKREESAQPKPTTALEYCHGRREEGKKIQTAHFWEVGGGSELHMLMDVVINPENIHTLVLVIVLDLSNPSSLWETLMSSLDRSNKRIQECYEKMRSKGNTNPDKLLQRHRRKMGEDHPDADSFHLNGIPTIIVANKYDLFHDDQHIKVMAKTLRYMAHIQGAHLIWCSTRDEKDMTKWRSMLANVVFNTPFLEKYMNSDYTVGPLLLWQGRDSLASIGPPIGLQSPPDGFRTSGDPNLDRFKQPFDDAYPPKQTQKQEKDNFTTALYEEFAEPAIDALRAQKDEELKKAETVKKGKKEG